LLATAKKKKKSARSKNNCINSRKATKRRYASNSRNAIISIKQGCQQQQGYQQQKGSQQQQGCQQQQSTRNIGNTSSNRGSSTEVRKDSNSWATSHSRDSTARTLETTWSRAAPKTTETSGNTNNSKDVRTSGE
jgi:hypothetical protein